MKKKIIIITSVILILVGGWLVYKAVSKDETSDYERLTVERGDIVQTVSVAGTVIPAKQIDLEFETSGKIQEVRVEVGDEVREGEILVRLNTGELSAQLQSYQAALEIAQAKLAKELAGTRPEDIRVYETAVENAQVTVNSKKQALLDAQEDADNDLAAVYEDALDTIRSAYTKGDKAIFIVYVAMRQEYFNGIKQLDYSIQEKENAAKNVLSEAETYLDIAEASENHDDIDLALTKMKTAMITTRDALAYLRSAMDDPTVESSVASADESTVDTERTTIDTELINVNSAQQTVVSTKTANQTNLNTAQANLEAAEAALKKAQDELALKKAGPRSEDIDLLEAEVKQARANVSQIQAKINKLILKAPVDGVITAVEKEEGETVSAAGKVVSMINSGHFQIEANVSETEIPKVQVGDRAEITLDALGPDEKFPGQILEIDPAETVVSGVIYYRVTSVFDIEDERIKPGMTVNLDIETDKKEDVLFLPYYAIREEDGQSYVWLIENKKKKQREVETGLEGETRVEIIRGLNQGDEVLVER